MSDYKELIEQLDGACCFKMVDGDISKADLFARAADAIEHLVRERDAAVADLAVFSDCTQCKYRYGSSVCEDCNIYYDKWEWLGLGDNDGKID